MSSGREKLLLRSPAWAAGNLGAGMSKSFHVALVTATRGLLAMIGREGLRSVQGGDELEGHRGSSAWVDLPFMPGTPVSLKAPIDFGAVNPPAVAIGG